MRLAKKVLAALLGLALIGLALAGLADTGPGHRFLIENFGLTPFYPSSFQDRPAGWVQPADGTRMTTGRVREVLRPGLADRDGELRVPSRVTVE